MIGAGGGGSGVPFRTNKVGVGEAVGKGVGVGVEVSMAVGDTSGVSVGKRIGVEEGVGEGVWVTEGVAAAQAARAMDIIRMAKGKRWFIRYNCNANFNELGWKIRAGGVM